MMMVEVKLIGTNLDITGLLKKVTLCNNREVAI